jgi:toxoflavin synthase
MSDPPDQYDAIGELYERVKHIPVGLAERATLLSALPDLRGRSVLDIGCGTGFYPRLFRNLGAARVVGVDASREMISHAQSIEERDPLGISYEMHDAASLPVVDEFDLVTAVWLLGHAEGEAALDAILTRIRPNVAPSGVFVALYPNPDVDWDVLAEYGSYGLTATRTEVRAGRQGCVVHVLGDPPFDFELFFWPPGVVEAAVERAGFTDVTRHPTEVPDDSDFWSALLHSPTFAVVSCHVPASSNDH